MPSKVKIICIPPAMIGQAWPLVGPVLLRGQLVISTSMGHALNDLANCLEAVTKNEAQAWIVVRDDTRRIVAAMISEITTDLMGRKVVFVSRMAGEDIGEWGHDLSERMAEFAKAEGCAAVMFYGRPALVKVYSGVKVVGKHASGVDLFERAVA